MIYRLYGHWDTLLKGGNEPCGWRCIRLASSCAPYSRGRIPNPTILRLLGPGMEDQAVDGAAQGLVMEDQTDDGVSDAYSAARGLVDDGLTVRSSCWLVDRLVG